MSKAISIWRSRIWLGPVLIPTPIHRESSLGQGHIDMRINIFAYCSLGQNAKIVFNNNYPVQDQPERYYYWLDSSHMAMSFIMKKTHAAITTHMWTLKRWRESPSSTNYVKLHFKHSYRFNLINWKFLLLGKIIMRKKPIQSSYARNAKWFFIRKTP